MRREVIVLSRNVQDYFHETYGRETRFVPNGIERGERVPAQEITERFGLAKDGYILFLGRIVPEKGVHYLIDAFKRLDTDKKLVIAGGSSDSNEYFERIKQQAAGEPRIVFTGFVEGRTLAGAVQQLIYICAAQRFGGYADESAGGDELRQLLPDFRYSRVHGGGGGQAATFEHGSVDSLRDSLQGLLEDPQAVQRYKADATGFITSKYDWDAVTERTLAYMQPTKRTYKERNHDDCSQS